MSRTRSVLSMFLLMAGIAGPAAETFADQGYYSTFAPGAGAGPDMVSEGFPTFASARYPAYPPPQFGAYQQAYAGGYPPAQFGADQPADAGGYPPAQFASFPHGGGAPMGPPMGMPSMQGAPNMPMMEAPCYSDEVCHLHGWQPGGVVNAMAGQPLRRQFIVEALFLYRDRDLIPMLGQDFLTAEPLIGDGAGNIPLEWGEGVRFIGGWDIGTGVCIVGEYFRIEKFGNSQKATSPGIVSPIWNNLAIFETGTLDYSSDLNSAEVGLQFPITFHMNFLAEFRYLHLGEDARLRAESDFWGIADAVARTRNDLYGFQTGVLYIVDYFDPIRFDAVLKAGIYSSQITRESVAPTIPDVAPGSSVSDKLSRAAFIGEIGIRATWEVFNHVGATVGYEAMWIDGVALAPDNFSYVGSIQTGQTPFFHGGFAGVEARF
ncbi:MAG: hypothetical protein ACOY3P_25545 [Planctomycetota bacterium]